MSSEGKDFLAAIPLIPISEGAGNLTVPGATEARAQ